MERPDRQENDRDPACLRGLQPALSCRAREGRNWWAALLTGQAFGHGGAAIDQGAQEVARGDRDRNQCADPAAEASPVDVEAANPGRALSRVSHGEAPC